MKGLTFVRGSVWLAGESRIFTTFEARGLLLALEEAVGVTQAPVTPQLDLPPCKQPCASALESWSRQCWSLCVRQPAALSRDLCQALSSHCQRKKEGVQLGHVQAGK